MEMYSNQEYKMAHTELLEILRHIPKKDLIKIPKDYINLCIEDSDRDYKFKYNINLNFEEQNIMKLTKILIINLYIKYWATEERKKEIKNAYREELYKEELKKQELYNPDKLFKVKENKTELSKSLVPVKKKN